MQSMQVPNEFFASCWGRSVMRAGSCMNWHYLSEIAPLKKCRLWWLEVMKASLQKIFIMSNSDVVWWFKAVWRSLRAGVLHNRSSTVDPVTYLFQQVCDFLFFLFFAALFIQDGTVEFCGEAHNYQTLESAILCFPKLGSNRLDSCSFTL